jgi:hypothetical protein
MIPAISPIIHPYVCLLPLTCIDWMTGSLHGNPRKPEAQALLDRFPAVLLKIMDDYLSKPFTQSQLQALLEKWLSRRRDRRAA